MGNHWCSLAASLGGIVLAILPSSPAAAQDAECVASIRIDGHRGTGANDRDNPFAENTLPSFEQAVAEGADVVELDIRLSADGTLVVLHGDLADESTDGDGCVNELSDEQIAMLDAGLSGMPAAVPTLAQVLTNLDSDLNLDVKITSNPGCAPDNPAAVAAAVKEAIDSDEADRNLFVSSFSLEFLTSLRALDADVELAFLSVGVPTVEDLTNADLTGVNLNFSAAALDAIPGFQEAGLTTAVWTINAPADMQQALDAGVDVIITDEPEVAVAERADFCTVPDDMPPDDTDGDTTGGDMGGGDNGGCAVGSGASSQPWILSLALVALLRRRRRAV